MNDKQEAKFQELTGQPVGHLVCKMAAPTIISMMVTACLLYTSDAADD